MDRRAKLCAIKTALRVEMEASAALRVAAEGADAANAARTAAEAWSALVEAQTDRATRELEEDARLVDRVFAALPLRVEEDCEQLWTLGYLRMQVEALRREMIEAVVSTPAGGRRRPSQDPRRPSPRHVGNRNRRHRIPDADHRLLGVLLSDLHEQAADLRTPRTADEQLLDSEGGGARVHHGSAGMGVDDFKRRVRDEQSKRANLIDQLRSLAQQSGHQSTPSTTDLGTAAQPPLEVRLARLFGLDEKAATPASIMCAVALLFSRTTTDESGSSL